MATANTDEGRQVRGNQPLRRLVFSLCNLLAVISLSLIFGGVLGMLLQMLTGQR